MRSFLQIRCECDLPERRNAFSVQSLHIYLYMQLKARFYKLARAYVSWDNEIFYYRLIKVPFILLKNVVVPCQ